ncbi:MAG: EAL domain-containing protein [Ruminococcus sp.]|uniref:putative bifunctional diguanylate cyclase/phosphodiesterase n=1 Tax=Ruminococcus sp. TaxID=41978 RepID=UPI0025CEBD76|nr:bifunctional diguanylate cyclase/phosphodiesterase [Ruminococcus sp.]MBR5682826.1 EAL domain-containing protein [Ruminococcus sp.]
MKKNRSEVAENNILQKTIESFSENKQAPIVGYVALVVVYIALIVATACKGSNTYISIADLNIPINAFAGILSALSNICVILMVVYYKKLGFYTALTALIIQLPMLTISMLRHHSLAMIPGIFTDFLTIIAIMLIYDNNYKNQKYQERIRDQAVTDRLTEIPNRFACSELVSSLIRRGDEFAMVSIDLNNFKGINDTMGFNIGNKVLIEIASRWKSIADTGVSGTLDFITRIAGDEFSLIIRNYHSDDDIMNTIKQYESALGRRLTIDNVDLYISASFGYAKFPTDAKTSDSLFSYADAAMTEVKRAGSGNHILRFSPDLLKKERTLEIERKLREALENETIYFNLQPQYSIDHKLRGFEALARMKDSDGNVISPGEFIPVAEKVGIIDKVDGMVMKKSAAFFGELLKRSGADITLSVNVSVKHMMKNDFLDELREIINTGEFPANQLEIEITESVMIDSAEKALQCIEEIKKMGIKIAIDDFGTGYSSLSYLNKFPANLLKIDKSFIDDMNKDDSSKQYVAAIISIGHIMGLDVIAEGVEEEEQLVSLKDIGCDYIQGFIWGRPLPMNEAERLVMGEM